MKLDKMEIPVIMFIFICGIIAYLGYKWGSLEQTNSPQ